ncbi:MAG: hypothetical protein IKQ17_00060 [Kiritimatiellae bacterium]|nr:hypothetical protein [Kiritimatiellia bacterium]
MKKLLIFCVAAMAMTTVHAATITLTTSDASGKSSFDTWNVSGGGTAAPSSDKDYVVDSSRYIRVRDSKMFAGKSLTFGKVGVSEGRLILQLQTSDTRYIGFANDGAILNRGHFTTWMANRKPTIGGTVNGVSCGYLKVCSPENTPFRIAAAEVTSSTFNTNNVVTISAPVKGAVGTALRLCAGGNATLPAANDTFTVTGDLSGFKGKLIVSGGAAKTAYDAVPVQTVFETITMGGTTVVENGALIRARYTDRTYTTSGLELKAGSILQCHNNVSGSKCGKIAVTESLTVEPGAVVRLTNHPYVGSGFNAYEWVALTFPAAKGTIPLENFVCPDLEGYTPCTLSTNLVDGVWQLVIRKQAHDVLSVNDSSDMTISHALPSACTNAASWKSGNAPQPGKMYQAINNIGGLGATEWPIIRTPYYSNTATPFVFDGDCLVLGQGGAIYPCSKDVTFPCLNLSQNTTYILSLAAVPSYLRGKLHLNSSSDAYPQKIQAYMKGLNTVAAEVSGSGTLNIMGRSGSSNPYGDIEFTALNINFTGRIKVYANVNNVAAGPDDYKHERVFVTDARNLGGPLAEFRADALELADYSVLEARNDVDLNVANRGVKISGNAGMSAPENVTLKISNDITYDGTLRKTGAGVLALNGAARVAGGASAALSVSEGYVSVGSTNVLNGVSTTFADGAYLLVDPATTGDVATFGAVDLSAVPFGGTLPVAFDLPALAGNQRYRYSGVAVCTVADAAKAAALTLEAKKIQRHSVSFSTRANADGTVTVVADINAKGFVLVVR